MKKSIRNLLLVFALMICCSFSFVGCTFTNPFTSSSLTRYSATQNNESSDTTTAVLFTSEEITEGLTPTQIAEEYISISFTVIIAQVTETTPVGGSTSTSEQTSSLGSGFVVREGGYVLTNYHVISDVLADPVETISAGTGATKKVYYKAYLSQDGGDNCYDATILWSNSNFDMAILVCDHFADLPAAYLKDRTTYCSDEDKINVLEQVITVGTQSDLEYYNSATLGYISSDVLRIAISDTQVYEHLIQHHAVINHGNSGGALIDADGNVIGLNTLGDDNANLLFFAVSIYPAIVMLDKVVENWEQFEEKTQDITFGFTGADKEMNSACTEEGVYVMSLGENCIINELEVGDIIKKISVSINDVVTVFDTTDQFLLLCARANLLYAQSATITVVRNGAEVVLTLGIGD